MRKWIIILALVFSLITTVIFASNRISEKSIKYSEAGSMHKSLMEERNTKDLNNENRIVAKVNGEILYSYDLESLVISHEVAGNDYSEDEILRRMIRSRILMQKAREEGYVASEKEVELELEAIREAYEEDNVFKDFIVPYLEGLSMTFEEYLLHNAEAIRTSLIIVQMKRDLLKEVTREDYSSEWDDLIDEWVSEADIVLFKQIN